MSTHKDTELEVALVAWFPADQYDQACDTWPDLTGPDGLARGGRDHAGYCRALQAKIRASADGGLHHIHLAPINVAEFTTWAAEQDEPTGDIRLARATFNLHNASEHPERLVPWPPGRNEPCWCGSGHKYKKCCAAPGNEPRR
jgi:hypothetical protein